MRPVADGSMLATASFDNYVILWFVIAYASFVVLIYWYRSVDEAGRAQKLSSVSFFKMVHRLYVWLMYGEGEYVQWLRPGCCV